MPKFTYAAVAGCCPGYLKVELPLTWDWLFLIIMSAHSNLNTANGHLQY
jgi:hypothetical protein